MRHSPHVFDGEVEKLLGEGVPVAEILRLVGCSNATVYRIKRKLGWQAATAARRERYERQDVSISADEHCRCGLRKPCHNCIAPLHVFAIERRGGGPVW